MALKLILGNSGSGKTEYMYQQIAALAEANPRKNYLLIVPEQFTMQTQRKLVDLSSHQAIMNIDVLSFQRLAYRVFDDMGIRNLRILEESGKNLVLRKVAQEQEDKLSILKSSMHRMGYIGEMKSLISELMQYNISPQRLAECVQEEKFSHTLQAKLRDVSVMYQAFADYLKKEGEENLITAEELLHVLAKLAPEAALLKDSVIVLDEFTGFTPVQVEFLQKLLPLAEQVWVSLTIDAKENFYYSKGRQELFDLPKKTIRTLLDLAERTGVELLKPLVFAQGEQKRFADAPALYFLEQNLFRSTYQRRFGQPKEIEIVCLKNPKEELAWAARKINDLVQNHSYRYKEIAVVSGDVEMYGNYVEQVCRKYKIPYFLDTTKEVLFHPFIEFIRAIPEVVSSDFSYHALMRLLRSGYCGFKQKEVDKLENYLLATGIRGKKMWSKRWLRVPKNEKAYDIEALEQSRKRFMEDFLPVLEVFSGKHKVEEQIKAIYSYIVNLEIEQKLREKEAQLLEEGEQAKSKEYGQIYRIVMDIFEKCIAVLGQEVLSLREFTELLDAGFEAAKVAVLPPGYDSVTIGDIERSRLNGVKVLLFLGVNEGIVPKSAAQGGIISEYERDSLEEAEISLAPGAREQAFIQKYYLYLNMTKPSQHLYLSYSRVDSEGKTLRPSYLIRTILNLFPDMRVQEIGDLDLLLDVSTEDAANDYLLSAEHTAEWLALAKCFLESPKERLRERSRTAIEAFFYQYRHDPISHAAAEALYGTTITGSVTRLENFAKCAYAHFLSYGLQLREREESGFESIDMGNLYHNAVEIYSRKLAESPYDWFCVPEEIRDAFAEASMEEAVLAYPNLGIYASAENTHMLKRMHHIFRQTIWALTTQVRKGQFVPNDFEISFSAANHLDALHFELEQQNKMQLKGRIDRLDSYIDENRFYIKVIDYKSGNTKFDLLKLYHGLQLQLVLYMNVAMELEKKKHPKKEVLPGGLFYYHIDDPVLEVTGEMSEAEIAEAILKELKPDGLVNQEEAVYRAMDGAFEQKSDVIPVQLKKDGSISESLSSTASAAEFQVLSDYVNNRIVQSGNAIYQGNIEIAPYADGQTSGCAYCPYHAVCGFDRKIEGFSERKEKKIEKHQILEQMEIDNARSAANKKQKGTQR